MTYIRLDSQGGGIKPGALQHAAGISSSITFARAGARSVTTSVGSACAVRAVEVVTGKAPALADVIEELIPAVFHNTGQYQNNRVEADHGRLKARLRPMRGLKTDRTASVEIRGHAFIQNLRRGHYQLGVDTAAVFLLATAFDELRIAI